MLEEKRMLTDGDIQAQMALELPSRELPLVSIVVANVIGANLVAINVETNIAIQKCTQILTFKSKMVCVVAQS